MLTSRCPDNLLESQSGLIQVLWPVKIMKKLSKSAMTEVKLITQTELKSFRLLPTLLPIVRRIGFGGA